MARRSLAVLLGLVLGGTSLAQNPDHPAPPAPITQPAEELQAPAQIPPATTPMPEPVAPMDPAAAPAVLSGTAGGPAGASDVVNGWQFWANADYALGWLKNKKLPPLVTSSPPGTVQGLAGVITQPDTTVVIGNQAIANDARQEGKLGFGLWFNPERTLGVDAGYFTLESKGQGFTAASDGTTILAQPFVDVVNRTQASALVSFPGVVSGSVNVTANMQTFWGANIDLREAFLSEDGFRLESLIGYRYLHYGESLNMQNSIVGLGGTFVPGTTILSNDAFVTFNDFHGGEIGFRGEVSLGRLSMELLTKLAAGSLHREVRIAGSTVTTVPGTAPVTNVGGVYALSSNIGIHDTSAWVVAPELGFTLRYAVTNNICLRGGYSFLYLQEVARAADQIDFAINPNLFPPAANPVNAASRPAFDIHKSDIWLQSIQFGVEFRF